MEVSFFAVCPLKQMRLQGPEKRDEVQPTYANLCGVVSSRFSGQLSKRNKGIAKKDTSMPMGLAMGAYGGIQQ